MADFITLTCPSCGGKMNVNASANFFKCEFCGNEHFLSNLDLTTRSEQCRSRPDIPQPAEITLDQDGFSLRLVRRWFSWKYIPMAIFCVAWDAFLLFWYSIVFTQDAPWIMGVFPVAHVAVGLGLTYSTLTGFFNQTCLEINPQELHIWHTPFPWPGEKRIAISQIKQLYSKSVVKRTSESSSTVFELHGITRDGRTQKLLSNLDSVETALFLEQQIERWLRIEDQPVAGEIDR